MNKAEEEAERIVEMYWDDFCPKDHFPNNNYCECNSLTQIQAIKCALIHVEGIIDEIKKVNKFYEENGLINSDVMIQPFAHWQEVKQELNKML